MASFLRKGIKAAAIGTIFLIGASQTVWAADPNNVTITLPQQSVAPFANVEALKEQARQRKLPMPGQPAPQPESKGLPQGFVAPPDNQQSAKAKPHSVVTTPSGAALPPPVAQPAAPLVQQVPGNRPLGEDILPPQSIPKDRKGQLESWQVDSMSASSFADLLEDYKKIVNESKKQNVPPRKRSFVELSRNYVNIIHCDGKIENLIIPQDRGIEAQILNDNHDLFLRVGAVDTRQFPLDMSLICEGNVYLINAVVHPHVPSQEVVLDLPKGVRPLAAQERTKFQEAIAKSEALPLETQVSKIIQRVYAQDMLPYWKEIDSPSAQSRWSYGSYSVLLQKVIDTNISSLLAWDFVFRGRVAKTALYDTIRKVVRGEIVAYGKVAYDEQSATRIIVLTKK